MDTSNRTARFALRLTTDERHLLQLAANVGGEDVSAFVRRMALSGARVIVPNAPPPQKHR